MPNRLMSDALHRPVWNSLSARQRDLAIGDARALRMAPEYGPFAAAQDHSEASLTALAALVIPGTDTWIVERDPLPSIKNARLVSTASCVQMVMPNPPAAKHDARFDTLTEDDAPDMRRLAAANRPGPFSTATHRLGRFIGIRQNGALVAMAGERMRPPGYTEVSGVCTDPAYRGRGLAAMLITEVARQIFARGDLPFLHSYAANESALALYERLGFRRHGIVTASILQAEST